MTAAQPLILVETSARSAAIPPGIQVMRLNYPSKRNALSLDLRAALIAAVESAMADPAVRVLVLTGSGGAFCAGGDISTMQNVAGVAGRQRLGNLHRLARMIVAGPKPVIAAVEGYAYGAGMSLALLCGRVVAASDAKFCCSFGKVGLMPDLAALWTVPQRVNAGWVKRLLMLAEEIDGDAAGRIGLADEVTAPGEALTAALALAAKFAAWRRCRSASSRRRWRAARSLWRRCWHRKPMVRRCCSTRPISPRGGMPSSRSANRSLPAVDFYGLTRRQRGARRPPLAGDFSPP